MARRSSFGRMVRRWRPFCCLVFWVWFATRRSSFGVGLDYLEIGFKVFEEKSRRKAEVEIDCLSDNPSALTLVWICHLAMDTKVTQNDASLHIVVDGIYYMCDGSS